MMNMNKVGKDEKSFWRRFKIPVIVGAACIAAVGISVGIAALFEEIDQVAIEEARVFASEGRVLEAIVVDRRLDSYEVSNGEQKALATDHILVYEYTIPATENTGRIEQTVSASEYNNITPETTIEVCYNEEVNEARHLGALLGVDCGVSLP